MIDRDPYLTIDEAERLTGLARRTIFERIAAGLLAVKPSEEASANGRPQSLVRLGDLSADAQLRYWQQQLAPAGAAAEAAAVNLAEVPASAREEALRRLPVVLAAQEIVQARGEITARLRELAAAHRLSLDTVYAWLRAYEEHGFGGLLPKWGGKKGRFTAISEALQGIIKDEYLRPERPSVTDVHRAIAQFCDAARIPCPSISTLNRFLATLPKPAVLAARYGEAAYRAQGEPKIRRDYLDLDVGEMWVGDHRVLDLFVRASDEPGAKIFRPWLTAWMDLRSRRITGWHLDLVPDSHTIALALRAGILTCGLPTRLYRDNGKDFTAEYWGGRRVQFPSVDFDVNARAVLAQLRIEATNAQPFSPWAKAIEAWFGHTLPSWERTLPGWCGRDNKEKPEKLTAEVKAGRLLTLAECQQALAARIEQYHDREHSELAATPRSLWAGVEMRIPDARALDLILMKHKPAKVFQDGLRLFGRRYWHDALIPHIGQTVEIRYDAADVSALVVMTRPSASATPVFLCEARWDHDQPMDERGAKEAVRRRRAAKQVLERYREAQAIAWDPDVALKQVANDRRQAKIVTLRRAEPAPEPSGGVVPTVTGFERPAPRVRTHAHAEDALPASLLERAPRRPSTMELEDEKSEILKQLNDATR
ncbi:Mu transposase C-terminal domain-containing protein [Candidatus Nitrospira bockiana]